MQLTTNATPRRRKRVARPLWTALRSAPKPQSIADLMARCPGSYDTVHTALKRWQDRGAVVCTGGNPLRFHLKNRSDDTPPDGRSDMAKNNIRERSARQRIWAAMRVLKTFDKPTLQMTADAPPRAVATFLDQLQRAKYVQMVERGLRQTGRASVYRLVRNSGPKCPTTNRPAGALYLLDNNTGRRIDISPGAVSLRSKSSKAQADGGVS